MTDPQQQQKSFLDEAADDDQPGLMGEFVEFMRENAKWWLTPILVVLGLLGALVLLAASPIAPFVYSLF